MEEIKENDNGKKVKVTRKLARRTETKHVNKAVAERKKWAKFGEEEGNKPGPDSSTTTIGEKIEFVFVLASDKVKEFAMRSE